MFQCSCGIILDTKVPAREDLIDYADFIMTSCDPCVLVPNHCPENVFKEIEFCDDG